MEVAALAAQGKGAAGERKGKVERPIMAKIGTQETPRDIPMRIGYPEG